MDEINGLSVRRQGEYQIASLRHFHPAGSFAARVRETIGRPLAEPLCAHRIETPTGGAPFTLLWRSPTENLYLTEDAASFAALQQRLAGESDGCMVDQTGGIRVLRVAGPKAPDLLLRLGAGTAIPPVGGACTGRLAEVPVLTACIQTPEYLLLVERVYANHLLDWIGATTADLE